MNYLRWNSPAHHAHKEAHTMNRKLSAVRTARRNGNAIREFIATADPFALDMLIGPPEMRRISGDRIDNVITAREDCQRRQRRKYGNQAGNPLTLTATPYNPE